MQRLILDSLLLKINKCFCTVTVHKFIWKTVYITNLKFISCRIVMYMKRDSFHSFNQMNI